MDSSNLGSKRSNILVLDGGGVRGLSSLLILQALMIQINRAVANLGVPTSELHPHHVFQLVAGTSTGGLIALMLGKIGLTVDECITQYEKLSKVVFGKKHFRGRLTHGLAPARYSGKGLRNCIRGLLQDCKRDENLLMEHKGDQIACSVICREHSSSSKYSKLKNKAVPICSLPCKDKFICKVCDAARATSAAPTFFPVMEIEDRFFADGGLSHNNPSFSIYFHYTGSERKKSTRNMTTSAASAPQFSPHGKLDCSRVRFTNIGTGAKVDEVQPGKRDRLAGFVPGFIKNGVFLKQTLTEIAVNSEEKAEIMRHFQHLNEDIIMYERFDANHGVSNIKLDNHKALGEIRAKTELYLEEQDTRDLLVEVGTAIAKDYLNIMPREGENERSSDLSIDNTRASITATTLVPPSLSSGPSSNTNETDNETPISVPKYDSLQNGGPAPLTKHPTAILLTPDGQE